MCNRYTLVNPDAAFAEVARILGVSLEAPAWATPRYNIAPTQIVPTVVDRGGGAAPYAMHFGLLAKGSPRMIPNARAETAYAKRSFKNVAPTRRCAIPTSGFIDWLDDEGRKRPHCFTLATDKPFAMGALWNPGDEPAGVPPSFCIVTTEPNELVARVHNRMPVILRDEHLARWLDPAPMTEPEFLRIAERIPSSAMAAREVSDTINSSRNEGPDCIAPPAPRDTQMGLF